MTTENGLLLIVNPQAGRAQAKEVLYDLLRDLDRVELHPTVCFTRSRGDARRLAAELGTGRRVVACVGGDGTLSEVMNGLMAIPGERRPLLGYVPLGTGNDMAVTLGIPKDPRFAGQIIGMRRRIIDSDIGHLDNERYFGYVAAFGAFTEVSYGTKQETKRALGYLAYLLEGLAAMPRIVSRHAAVEYDDGIIQGDFIFGAVTNSTSVAHLVRLSSQDVELCDGAHEVMLVRRPQNILELSGTISDLLSKTYDPERVLFLHTRRIRFTFDEPVPWTLDGEDGGERQVVSIVNCHNALRIIV